MAINNEVREWLLAEAEADYKEFSSALLPNINNVLGIRLPKLRSKARELIKSQACGEFIANIDTVYMEETMLQGMVIGLLKLDASEKLKLIKNFVNRIDNWSVCDSFCVGLKFIPNNRELVWKFLQPYLKSEKEFELRFAVVILLDFFVTDEWIDKILPVLFALKSDFYYAQMGIAWAISVCLVKFFDKTYFYLSKGDLQLQILKKAVQKGCDSYRLTSEQKAKLRELV